MPTFEAYEAAVADSLKTIDGVKTVGEYSGDLSAAALKKVAPRDSGIMMVALGGTPAQEQPSTGQLAFMNRTGLFIVTRNARGSTERAQEGRKLGRAVMLHVRNNQWGLMDTHPADIEKLENRSSKQVDDAGYAIWLVVFKQIINLDEVPVDNTVINQVTIKGLGDTEQVIPV